MDIYEKLSKVDQYLELSASCSIYKFRYCIGQPQLYNGKYLVGNNIEILENKFYTGCLEYDIYFPVMFIENDFYDKLYKEAKNG